MAAPRLTTMSDARARRLKEALLDLYPRPAGPPHLVHCAIAGLFLLAVGFGAGASFTFFHFVPQVCR